MIVQATSSIPIELYIAPLAMSSSSISDEQLDVDTLRTAPGSVQKLLNIAILGLSRYVNPMNRTPFHPTTEQIELPRILDCLSDPVRLAIVVRLADADGGSLELRCRDFSDLGGKSNLAYHFEKLRDAGLVWTRLSGTNRFMQLRRQDLEARFPGLLDVVINSANRDAEALRLPMRDLAVDVDALLNA